MDQESLINVIEKAIGPLLPMPRDWCDWCQGRGCVACAAKRKALDEEYARQFPNGPEPIFTARRDNPEEMEALKRIVGREAVEKAFGPGGGGIAEIEANAAAEKEKLAAQKKGNYILDAPRAD